MIVDLFCVLIEINSIRLWIALFNYISIYCLIVCFKDQKDNFELDFILAKILLVLG